MKEEGLAGGFGGKKERVHEEEMSWRTRKKKRRWEVGRWDEGETKEKTWKRNREEGRRSFGVGGNLRDSKEKNGGGGVRFLRREQWRPLPILT